MYLIHMDLLIELAYHLQKNVLDLMGVEIQWLRPDLFEEHFLAIFLA